MFNVNYNPDVLTCLANLSNDEVFTPPDIANQLLDLLPEKLWSDKNATFLDPCTKSGIFLREITKRLLEGLKDEIPELQERIDHILTKQVFGIGITELTALLSRRSLYCSKNADQQFSITDAFKNDDGNILYKDLDHKWKNLKCEYCGASKNLYNREDFLEQHAYNFIHTNNPKELFNMKFDVIIGNPPYQIGDGGSFASASPLYHKFVKNAIKMNPRYLTMIIPARWYAGGKGLNNFRSEMLNDRRIEVINDFPIAQDCFPGMRIAGGVCYFLWNNNYSGDTAVNSFNNNKLISSMKRPLLEEDASTFLRMNETISIYRKVKKMKESSFSNIVSSRKPFNLATDFFKNPGKYDYPPVSEENINITRGGLRILGSFNYKTVKRYVPKNYPIKVGLNYIGKDKIFVSRALDNGFDWKKERLNPFLAEKNDICTENFLVVGPFKSKIESNNAINYMNTKFFHLFLFLKKVSQDVSSSVYEYIPIQDFEENSKHNYFRGQP